MGDRPIRNNSEHDSESETSPSHLELPKPDSENITVFTHNLPNQPILPWNHYDSPWKNTSENKKTEATSTESTTKETESDSEENLN